MIAFLATLTFGLGVGLWTGLGLRKTPPKIPIIHCRGTPGWYGWKEAGKETEYLECDFEDCAQSAAFADELGQYWCVMHGLASGAKQLERGVGPSSTGHKAGRCLTHDMDCPKPWSVVPSLEDGSCETPVPAPTGAV